MIDQQDKIENPGTDLKLALWIVYSIKSNWAHTHNFREFVIFMY